VSRPKLGIQHIHNTAVIISTSDSVILQDQETPEWVRAPRASTEGVKYFRGLPQLLVKLGSN
jgi:hypothetical protein